MRSNGLISIANENEWAVPLSYSYWVRGFAREREVEVWEAGSELGVEAVSWGGLVEVVERMDISSPPIAA